MDFEIGKRTIGSDQKIYLSLHAGGEYKAQLIVHDYAIGKSLLEAKSVKVD
jgi:hypothetical protein